jgi:hypothetical protein
VLILSSDYEDKQTEWWQCPGFKHYHDHLQEELPKAVHRRFESAFAALFGPLTSEDQLRLGIVNIVRESQTEIHESYHSILSDDNDRMSFWRRAHRSRATSARRALREGPPIYDFDFSSFLVSSPPDESHRERQEEHQEEHPEARQEERPEARQEERPEARQEERPEGHPEEHPEERHYVDPRELVLNHWQSQNGR